MHEFAREEGVVRRSVVLAVGLAVVLLAAAVLLAGRLIPTASTSLPPAPGVLMVDDLRSDPGNSPDEIVVLGVVGGISVERQRFGLIDPREVEACGTVDCAEFILPVAWDGGMPAVYELVLVTGRVQESAEGLVLAASKVVTQ